VPNLAVKKKVRPLGTFRPPARDLDLGQLRLMGGGRGQVADLKRAISSGELQQTIEGASTLTLKVRDYTRALLNSALLQNEAHLTLDNIEYSLAKVSHDGDELGLIFEETAVNLLRKYDLPRKASRDATTRAQFIRGLVREVRERLIPFNCPEVNERQPVAAAQVGGDIGGGSGSSSYKPAQGGGNLTINCAKATQHQLDMGKLVVETTRGRGGDYESCAGAVATAIQESNLTNMAGGDRDSQGLYQQRPSMGWGSVAQIRNPPYAIGKFLDQFLAYRRKGEGWLTASHHTQRSAYPSAPARWFTEGQKFASFFGGSGGGDLSFLAGSPVDGAGTTTQVQPYEFSRGTADKRESSWDCSGRLADEVQWRRFMRGGALWYVSDEWLINRQRVSYRLSERTPGVISLRFDHETRHEAADATLQVASRRYSILPGDVVELTGEGAGNGKWLVKEVRRSLFSQIADVALTRKRPKLSEPAPQTSTISVGGSAQATSFTSVDGPDQAKRAYQAAEAISARNLPYSQAQRNLVPSPPSADCSSGVSWVLLQAGIPLPGNVGAGQWAPVSGQFEGWGEAGPGRYFTIMTNAGHIWIRWNGIGPAWRFDTSSYGDSYASSSGGRNRTTPRPTAGFAQRHWRGL
jgi:hypothetical protein